MLAAIAGGVLGAIAGGQRNTSGGFNESNSSITLQGINDLNKGRSATEAAADSGSLDQYNQLLALVNAGPGASAISGAANATNDYTSMLQNLLSSGGAPSAAQLGTAQSYASQVFAPQQLALQQQFQDQSTQAQRMAARLGRPGNDPILTNKLAQEQTRQQTMLNSQQGAYGAQYADSLLGRQLDLGQSLMNVRNGLATQALNNRTALLGLGQQLVNSERNYRVQTAGRSSFTNGEQYSGGGTAGAISGGLAGVGAGMGAGAAMPSWSSMFGSSTPSAAPAQASAAVGSSRFLSTGIGV
jgi:hypothetical protein